MEEKPVKATMIERLFRTFNLLKEKVDSSGQIRPRQIVILRYIHKCPNHRTTISNLARHYQITDAAASQMVTYFEKKGWVEKVRTEFDRRVVYVKVSDGFMAEMKEKFTQMMEDVNRYMTYLGPKDALALERILEKTIRYMEDETPEEKNI